MTSSSLKHSRSSASRRLKKIHPSERVTASTITSAQLDQLRDVACMMVATINDSRDRHGKISPGDIFTTYGIAVTAVEMLGIDPETIEFSSELDGYTFTRKCPTRKGKSGRKHVCYAAHGKYCKVCRGCWSCKGIKKGTLLGECRICGM